MSKYIIFLSQCVQLIRGQIGKLILAILQHTRDGFEIPACSIL